MACARRARYCLLTPAYRRLGPFLPPLGLRAACCPKPGGRGGSDTTAAPSAAVVVVVIVLVPAFVAVEPLGLVPLVLVPFIAPRRLPSVRSSVFKYRAASSGSSPEGCSRLRVRVGRARAGAKVRRVRVRAWG